MATNIGEEIMSNSFHDVSQIATAIIKLLNDTINNSKNHAYTSNDVKMIDIIKDYVGSGGNLIARDIEPSYAATYEKILKNNKIPYIATTITDPNTNKEMVVFLVRENDKQKLEIANEHYKHFLGYGLNQINSLDLAKLYENQSLIKIDNLSRSQIEVFKNNAVNQNVTYSIQCNQKNNTYSITYPKEYDDKMNNILTLTAYDLSGQKGKALEENILNEIENKKNAESNIVPLKNEVIYIVDALNPGNFIAIDKDSYSIHNVKMLSEKDPETGKDISVLKDLSNSGKLPYDKEQILRFAECTIQKPIVLSQEEMILVNGVEKNGKIKLKNPEQFRQNYSSMIKQLATKKEKVLPHFKSVAELLEENKTVSLTNIPENKINTIKSLVNMQGLKDVLIENNNVIYLTENKKAMDPILDKVLYENVSDEKRFELKCLYEDRGKINLKDENTYYIKDIKIPGYNFKLDNSGFTIYNMNLKKNEKVEPIFISRDSKQFESMVYPMLNSMVDPVVLNENEFKLNNNKRIELELSRSGYAKLNEDNVLLINRNIERNNVKDNVISESLKADVEKIKETWVKREWKVDRNFIEKISDHTLEEKIIETKGKKESVEPTFER